MKITQLELSIHELVEDYSDDGEDGVKGYSGRLDIRPAFQREFVYNDKQRNAVISTVRRELPLNVMYWADIGGGRFEIIDGQQRTVAICQYVQGNFSIDGMFFQNLQADQQQSIYDYPLMVYTCSGTDSERLDWFRTINIAGETLTEQELRNAVYHGSWVSDAKRYFSKPNCPAQIEGGDYLAGSSIRQDYLETAIRWINNGDIEGYMSVHHHEHTAVALWNHFNSVIAWVKATFPKYHKQMRGLDWGKLYDSYGDADLDPNALGAEITRLRMDDDVSKKSGIYAYVLDRDERHLNIRAFTDAMRIEAYERQQGICPACGNHFPMEEMEADHITPWSQGGKTNEDNCQMLCRECNRRKSDR